MYMCIYIYIYILSGPWKLSGRFFIVSWNYVFKSFPARMAVRFLIVSCFQRWYVFLSFPALRCWESRAFSSFPGPGGGRFLIVSWAWKGTFFHRFLAPAASFRKL